MSSIRILASGIVSFLVVSGSPHRLLATDAAFVRGDVNADGDVDVSDPISLLFHLFAGSPAPGCSSAADFDDNAALDLADVVGFLRYLFSSEAPPAPPFPECGSDPTPTGGPGCDVHAPCEGDRDPVITEWLVPWPSSRPRDPHVDTDGRVWFVGQNDDYAAFLEPASGEFKRFDLPAGAGPHNLIAGEHVWYAGNADAHIGKLDKASGEVTVFEMPVSQARDPHTLIFDQEGDIWFTVQRGNYVGRLVTATGDVQLVRVPTANAQPYGIVIDPANQPWFVEFGTNKLARIDRASLEIEEFVLPRAGTRPRRIGVDSKGTIWYVDYAQGYLGRFVPGPDEVTEWRCPGGAGARPYGMAVDDRDRIWFVETGRSPNRFVGFNPRTEQFFSVVDIPSGGGSVRHMYFHAPAREIWFGTDRNTIGRAAL